MDIRMQGQYGPYPEPKSTTALMGEGAPEMRAESLRAQLAWLLGKLGHIEHNLNRLEGTMVPELTQKEAAEPGVMELAERCRELAKLLDVRTNRIAELIGGL